MNIIDKFFKIKHEHIFEGAILKCNDIRDIKPSDEFIVLGLSYFNGKPHNVVLVKKEPFKAFKEN